MRHTHTHRTEHGFVVSLVHLITSHTLTVNSPVTASKPTWMVCSKSDGREISGRSFFL